MDFETLDVVSQLVAEAQGYMAVVSDVALQLGATIAATLLLFSLALRVAGGGEGTTGAVAGWIIFAGLVLGAISFWPTIATESFNTAEQLVGMTSGGSLSALDVVRRGFDWHARVWEHASSGGIWQMLTGAGTFLSMHLAALLIVAAHLWISLILAASILQFWIGAAIMQVALPFLFVPYLQGIGGQVLGFMIAATLRLVFLGVIIGVVRNVFLDIALPGAAETLSVEQVWAAGLAGVIGAFLAAVASSWSSTLTRGAVGGTGLSALGGAVFGGALRGGGAATAGAARAGQATAGAATAGTALAGGMPPSGGPPPGSAAAGSPRGGGGSGGGGSGVVGTQARP